MKKLNVAIIGQGRSGRDIHGLFLHTDEAKERFNVVAVVDEIESRKQRASEEWGVPVFSNYTDLFTSGLAIDLVVNSTYSHLHAPVAIDLLNHGYHVLTEKPACHNVEQFDEMCAAAEKNGKFLGIFQQSRFAPYFVQVKKVIDSGVLGRLVAVSIHFGGFSRRWDWQTLLSYNGGALRNTGPHPLDQALAIYNDYEHMPNVFCKMDAANSFGDAEDYCKLILTAPDKPLIDLTITASDAYPEYTYRVEGTRGTLAGTMKHIDWKYFDYENAPEQVLVGDGPISEPDGTPAYCHEVLKWTEESWEGDPNGAFDAAVAAYYKNMYEHIVDGAPLVVTLPQVRQQVQVFVEAHRQNGHLD